MNKHDYYKALLPHMRELRRPGFQAGAVVAFLYHAGVPVEQAQEYVLKVAAHIRQIDNS